MGALGKRDKHHATARDMHEPADTEPVRKTAGTVTVVILAGDTIGAIRGPAHRRKTTGGGLAVGAVWFFTVKPTTET
jgi:hypothetical protein